MNGINENPCRLCLNIINNQSYEVIGDVVREILEILLPNLSVDDYNGHSMCDICFKKLLAAFQFKSKCLYTEDKIFPYIENNKTSQLDLREIYAKEQAKQQLVSTTTHLKICRLCMEPVKRNFKTMRFHVYQNFLPELNFKAIRNAIVCTECHESFRIHAEFLKKCVDADKQAKFFLKNEAVDIKSDGNAPEVDIDIDVASTDTVKENTTNSESNISEALSEENVFNPRDNPKVAKRLNNDASSTYQCANCKYKSNQKSTLKRHILKKHRDIAQVQIYRCDECTFVTGYERSFQRHQSTHKDASQVQIYKCGECDYKNIKKGRVTQHQLVHKLPSEVQMYKCDKCKFEAKRRDSVRQHQLVHKDLSEVQTYKCDKCKFESKYKRCVRDHQLVHSEPEKVYQCDECQYTTKNKLNLNMHKSTHPFEVQMCRCHKCNFETRRKRDLSRHMLVHSDPSELRMYKCDKCSFETKRKRGLASHQLRHKEPSEVRMYKCNVCKYESKTKWGLTSHQFTHRDPSEVPVYRCDGCRYESKYKRNLLIHKLRHKDRSRMQT